MRFNEVADILIKKIVEDGYGGIAESVETIKTIKCKMIPYSLETVDHAGIPSLFSQCKLLTKEKIDASILENDFCIQYKNKLYNKLITTDYKKVIVIELESKQ